MHRTTHTPTPTHPPTLHACLVIVLSDVLIMRDVACAGCDTTACSTAWPTPALTSNFPSHFVRYVAGCNTRWFAQGEDGNFSASNAQDAIQARLSFAHDDTDRYASMLAFPCYEGQFNSGQLDTVMR